MNTPTSYCQAVAQMLPTDLHRIYHDTQYGFPIKDDNELFARLILEINQAGLSWTTILKKQDHFRSAFDQFEIAKVASYNEQDQQRLLNDAGIIRNRLKIAAAIYNAQVILELQKKHGSFQNWLSQHQQLAKAEWIKLFRQTFHFTGGEIVNEFLMSIGYLPGAHIPSCPIQKILDALANQ